MELNSFSLNLWVTEFCNLNCRYCYESENKCSKYLSKSVAEQVLLYIKNKVAQDNYDAIWINYHGGEPFLNFEIIKWFTDKIKKTFSFMKCFFSVTTNATIINDEILDYIRVNIGEITLSIDGTKISHDKNRVYKNGMGTHHVVMDNARKINSICSDKVRIRTVITPDNVENLYNDIMYLFNQGFKIICSGINFYDVSWNELHMECLKNNLIKLKFSLKDSRVLYSLFEDVGKSKGRCFIGGEDLQIATNGKIYACAYTYNMAEYLIGDIWNGVDERRCAELNKINMEVPAMPECDGCSNYYCCNNTRCFLVNKQVTGDYYKPISVVCALENIKSEVSGIIV